MCRITSGLDEEETEDFVDQGKWRSGVDDSEDSAVGGDVASLEFGDSAPAPGGVFSFQGKAFLFFIVNCQGALRTGSTGSGLRRPWFSQTILTQQRTLFAGFLFVSLLVLSFDVASIDKSLLQ